MTLADILRLHTRIRVLETEVAALKANNAALRAERDAAYTQLERTHVAILPSNPAVKASISPRRILSFDPARIAQIAADADALTARLTVTEGID